MRIELNYEELLSTIDNIVAIVEDSSVQEESLKTLIFWINENQEVYLVGHSITCLCKIKLDNAEVSDFSEENEFIQIKAGEFSKYLRSLSGMKETAVDRVVLDVKDNKVFIAIHEMPLDEEDELAMYLKQTSYFAFDRLVMSMDRKREISQTYQNVQLEGMITKDIRLYLDNLSKLIESSDIKSNASKLYFSDKHIYVIQSLKGYLMVMENTLRDEFKNISLTGAAVRFLCKFLTGTEVVDIGRATGTERGDNALVLSVDNTIVYLKYINKVPDITKMLNTVAVRHDDGTFEECKGGKDVLDRIGFIDRRNAIVIHKAYILEVMKRFKITDELMTVCIKPAEDTIVFRNSKTSITLPLIMKKGMEFGEITFKVKPDRFEEWFISDLDITTKEAFMYFIQRSATKYAVATLDSTGNWFCITNIAS